MSSSLTSNRDELSGTRGGDEKIGEEACRGGDETCALDDGVALVERVLRRVPLGVPAQVKFTFVNTSVKQQGILFSASLPETGPFPLLRGVDAGDDISAVWCTDAASSHSAFPKVLIYT